MSFVLSFVLKSQIKLNIKKLSVLYPLKPTKNKVFKNIQVNFQNNKIFKKIPSK